MLGIQQRAARHLRLTAAAYRPPQSPPFLTLFINSTCNMRCGHCFYWKSLNRRDDLTFDELTALSDSLGPLENLNLSGGEPFLRKEIAAICRRFVERNGVKQIYIPTNGYFTERTVRAVTGILEDRCLDILAIELSLDGTAAAHDDLRATPGAFERAMATYAALEAVQERDPRLRIHAISTATHDNVTDLRLLSELLYRRCARMDRHGVALLEGDRKDAALRSPARQDYEELCRFIRELWAPRDESRFGAIVDPLVQWTAARTAREQRQVTPCLAGKLSAVVYANGDVAVCENHEPLGNLREASFAELWTSPKARAQRDAIAQKRCWCTKEVSMWPSVVFQPPSLLRALAGAQRSGLLPVLQRPTKPRTERPGGTPDLCPGLGPDNL